MEKIRFILGAILAICLLVVTSTITFAICLLLIPFRVWRVKVCNYYGKITGYYVARLLGTKISAPNFDAIQKNHPAICLCNHASTLDVMTGIWLCPVGGVGIAKKEIIWIPVFGLVYLLSGHMLLDRGNREKAVKSMDKMCDYIKRKKLSLFVYPEGTRSKDGRLQPFKKGFVHLALATKLPLIPIICHNAHHKWGKKNGLVAKTVEIKIEVLDPIDTTDWTEENIDTYVTEIRQIFIDHLGEEQRPQE